MVFFSHFISDIISSQNPRPPLSANVSICPTPPPPFVSQCQHLPYPPSPLRQPLSAFSKPPPSPSAADIICEQPLIVPPNFLPPSHLIPGRRDRSRPTGSTCGSASPAGLVSCPHQGGQHQTQSASRRHWKEVG